MKDDSWRQMQGQEEEGEEEEVETGPLDIKDILKLNHSSMLKFGVVFPGMIKEQKLMIENPSKHNLTLKVKVDCLNKEFDDLEEYVYSIRKPPQFDYNDTYYVIMNEKDFITFQVAIKVPKIREKKAMLGNITISSEECEGEFNIRLRADTVVPIIYCPKVLFVRELGFKVVPFSLKFLRKK